jgi:predicted aspartyl protease
MRKFVLFVSAAMAFADVARAEVPLTWSSTGHIMVPVMVNGEGPYLFILDTAADGTGVFAWFAAAHALPKGHADQLEGATGIQSEITTVLGSLSVDGQTIRHVQADTDPDRADGVKFAGIVGVGLLGRHLTVIDTGCGTASLLPLDTDPAKAAGPGANFLRAGGVKSGTQLTFPATINGIKGTAILDTGAKSTIVNNVFAKAAGVNVASVAFTDGVPAGGATPQTVATRTGPIGTIRFAGIVRSNVNARVVDLPSFKDMGLADRPTINVGMDLLKGLRMMVDYRHHRIGFAPSTCRT